MKKEAVNPVRQAIAIPGSRDDIFGGNRSAVVPYHRMHGQPYCLPALMPYTADEAELLRSASETVDRIYRKVLRFVQRTLPDAFLTNRLGIHPAIVPAARAEVPFHVLSRQDWLLGQHGAVWIENNTDTPTGVPEAAYLAGSLIADYAPSYGNPSAMIDTCLQRALREIVGFYRSNLALPQGRLIFSAYDWHEEDTANTMYVMEQARLAGLDASFAPFEELEVVEGNGLYWRGERIAIWYRLYPLEFLAEDQDEEGFPIGGEVLRLAASGRLGLINPAQSAITQSKGFMPLIWSLASALIEGEAEDGHPLTMEDALFIRRHMPATYWTAEPFVQGEEPYVSKSMWGREGKGTAIIGSDGEPLHKDEESGTGGEDEGRLAVREADTNEGNGMSSAGDAAQPDDEERTYYAMQPKIYQQYIPMEQASAATSEGRVEGWLLTGVYVIGGRCCGLLPRIGGRVTGDLACFAPAVIVDSNPHQPRSEYL